ncbi:MAG: hypothetical protein ACK5P6_02085 [Pseudobdellovibrionaceae bacterium]
MREVIRSDLGTHGKQEDYQFSAIIDDLLCLIGFKLEKHQVHLKGDEVLPRLQLSRHRVRLLQIMTNLVKNAIKAIHHLEDRWVLVSFREDSKNSYFQVTDSGAGEISI